MRDIGKVDCEGFVASLAHNLKKAVRQLAGGRVRKPALVGAGGLR